VLDKTKLIDIVPGISDFELSEYIPVVAHYNDSTLVTRNGELLQIIEITGRNEIADVETLRESISKALSESISDYKFSVYLHTVRSRKNVMPDGKYESEFAQMLDDKWCAFNNFDKQLINTVYVTIIHQGLYNLSFAQSLKYKVAKGAHEKFLIETCEKLTQVTDSVLTKLQEHGARKLSVLEVNEGFVSEPLVFYYQLLHMDQKRVLLAPEDASAMLSSMKIKYDFNSIEIDNGDNTQHAAIFSIKDHYSASVGYLDKFLHLGLQYIITQTIIYVPAKEAKEKYKRAAEVGLISKSDDINHLTGFDRFLAADKGEPCDYCKQQTTITIYSDDKKFFEDKLIQLSKKLKELGIMAVREDFNMPRLFWSQLPGNFRFLNGGRFSYLDSDSIGFLCSIIDHESGNHRGSVWGPPISLLRNTYGTPFYLNFHNEMGYPHTLLVGPKGSGKTVVSRFLLTQAMKINPRIIYLDVEGNAQDYIEGVGGLYCDDTNIREHFKVSPFSGSTSQELCAWLIEMLCPKAWELPQYIEIFSTIADKLMEIDKVSDKIDALEKLTAQIGDTEINQKFQHIFRTGGIFNAYFSEDDITLLGIKRSVIGLDLTKMFNKDVAMFKAYALIFLLNIIRLFDEERPTIIYINNYNKLLDIKYFRENAKHFLNALTEHNTMLLVNMSHEEYLEKDDAFQEMMDYFGSKIFLSDKFADKYFKRAYKLTDDELHKIKSYSSARRIFLFKSSYTSAMLSLDLSSMKDDFKILGVTG
jgi:type IV secretion system protein VirB4